MYLQIIKSTWTKSNLFAPRTKVFQKLVLSQKLKAAGQKNKWHFLLFLSDDPWSIQGHAVLPQVLWIKGERLGPGIKATPSERGTFNVQEHEWQPCDESNHGDEKTFTKKSHRNTVIKAWLNSATSSNSENKFRSPMKNILRKFQKY